MPISYPGACYLRMDFVDLCAYITCGRIRNREKKENLALGKVWFWEIKDDHIQRISNDCTRYNCWLLFAYLCSVGRRHFHSHISRWQWWDKIVAIGILQHLAANDKLDKHLHFYIFHVPVWQYVILHYKTSHCKMVH